MASVHIQNLDIVLGGNTILKSMNLEVQQGEFLVLLGPSGCGKSTLLHTIAGFYEVTDGQILISDKDVTWADPKDRDIGMVFQSYALYPTMNVERNMSFGLRVAGLDKAEIERRVQRAAEMLHLAPLLNRRPSQLSGGQRQRVAIGRALVRDAKVFLFDEPLSNLDAQLRTELRRELKQLHQQIQATMIYVTHDQVEAMTLADRIAVMKAGVIQQIGTPDEIYHQPANLFVAGFLGSPNMNLLRGRLGVVDGMPHFVGDALSLPLSHRASTEGLSDGREVVLGVRPEQVVLETERSERAPYIGRITLVEPLGSQHIVWVSVNASVSLAVVMDSEWSGQVGDGVHWGVMPERVSLFDAASELRI